MLCTTPRMNSNSEQSIVDYKERIACLERELASREPQASVFKWVVIGILGAFGFLILLVVALMFLFTPLLKVDESTGRVQMFGGLVDIQAKNVIAQLSKEGSFVFGSISGAESMGANIQNVEILMGSGELRVDYNTGDEINWDCDGAGKSAKSQVSEKDSKYVLDFSAALVDCDVSLPHKSLKIIAQSGEVQVSHPKQPLSIKLERGTVSFLPEASTSYSYSLKATDLPSAEDFPVSTDKKAIPVSIEVIDGEISKLD
jgi:hypothetical protein